MNKLSFTIEEIVFVKSSLYGWWPATIRDIQWNEKKKAYQYQIKYFGGDSKEVNVFRIFKFEDYYQACKQQNGRKAKQVKYALKIATKAYNGKMAEKTEENKKEDLTKTKEPIKLERDQMTIDEKLKAMTSIEQRDAMEKIMIYVLLFYKRIKFGLKDLQYSDQKCFLNSIVATYNYILNNQGAYKALPVLMFKDLQEEIKDVIILEEKVDGQKIKRYIESLMLEFENQRIKEMKKESTQIANK